MNKSVGMKKELWFLLHMKPHRWSVENFKMVLDGKSREVHCYNATWAQVMVWSTMNGCPGQARAMSKDLKHQMTSGSIADDVFNRIKVWIWRIFKPVIKLNYNFYLLILIVKCVFSSIQFCAKYLDPKCLARHSTNENKLKEKKEA